MAAPTGTATCSAPRRFHARVASGVPSDRRLRQVVEVSIASHAGDGDGDEAFASPSSQARLSGEQKFPCARAGCFEGGLTCVPRGASSAMSVSECNQMSQSEDHPSKLISTRNPRAWPETLRRCLAPRPCPVPPFLYLSMHAAYQRLSLSRPSTMSPRFSRDHHDGVPCPQTTSPATRYSSKTIQISPSGRRRCWSCSIRVDEDARLGRSFR